MKPAALLREFPRPLLVVDDALQVKDCSRLALTLFAIRGAYSAASRQRLGAAIAADQELGDRLALATARLLRPGEEERFAWKRGERVYEVAVGAAADAFLVLFADVTDQAFSEEILLDARHYLEHILGNIPVGVAVLNRQLKITFMNHQQLQFLRRLGIGVSLVEAIGATLEALLPAIPGGQWHELCARVERGEEGAQLRQAYPQAGELVLAARAAPLRDHQGREAGAILVCEDVTAQTRLEQELIRVEKLAVVGQMVVAVNHEINNPLNIIANNAQALRLLHPELDEGIVAKLRGIEAQVKRIAAVTERLRSMEEISTEEYIADGPQMIDVWRQRPKE